MSPAEVSRLIRSLEASPDEVARRIGVSPSTIHRWGRGQGRPSAPQIALLRRAVAARVGKPAPFRFIDLFAGIGGMRLAAQAAGGQCVFSCEWNAFSRKTYAENFGDGPEHPFPEDITKVEPADVPEHDLLLAGFPCQPFSIAGVSKKNALGRPHGFSCLQQGNLFFNIADILAEKRPAAFLLENVKNLKGHDGGRTFARIRETLEDTLGYQLFTRVIDARAFVPQHRERIFLVGFRSDVAFSFDDLGLPTPEDGPRLASILHPEDGTERAEEPYTEGADAKVSRRYILTDHLWRYLQDYAAKHRAKGNGFGFGLVKPGDVARTLSARYYKDGSEILISRRSGNPRRLTPRECARLMGFDRGRRRFRIPVSDTQAYRQFGNAVAVPLVTAIIRGMVPHIRAIAGAGQLHLRFPSESTELTRHP